MKNIPFVAATVVSLLMCLAPADATETNSPAAAPVCSTCHGTKKCASCDGAGETRCSTCQGKGKQKERCVRCGGDGRISESRTSRSLGRTRRIRHTRSCPNCAGRGHREKNCAKCGADGKVSCDKCRGTKVCNVCKTN